MSVRVVVVGCLVSIAFGFSLPGCAYTKRGAPVADIPFREADYKIGGEKYEKVCNSYILGLTFGSSSKAASGGLRGSLAASPAWSPEVGEALYVLWDGIEQERAHLLPTTVATTFDGVGTRRAPVFGKRCGEVKDHAVMIRGPYHGTARDRGHRRENAKGGKSAKSESDEKKAEEGSSKKKREQKRLEKDDAADSSDESSGQKGLEDDEVMGP
jgi:hypothetical protein